MWRIFSGTLRCPKTMVSEGKKLMDVIYQATTEVRAAVVTSIATTIVSFLPVFAMQAQEGKLFHPLAFTKTFALLSAFILGIVVLPTMVHIFFNISFDRKKIKRIWNGLLIIAGLVFVIFWQMWPALAITAVGINNLVRLHMVRKTEGASKLYKHNYNSTVCNLVSLNRMVATWST